MQITMLVVGLAVGTLITSLIYLFAIGSAAKGNANTIKEEKSQRDKDMVELLNHWKRCNDLNLRQADALEEISQALNSTARK